ncbi:MAG: glycosyltransferase family 4 protein [Planctomycetota bacterium]|jgi:glycosyltransferase involved in cell wall biosynthesis
MKIAFSARSLSTPSGGVVEFIKSLVPALARQIGDDELYVYYNRREFVGLAPACSETVMESENRLWWDFVLLPKMTRKMKMDAAIFPKDVIPFFTGCHRYVIHHDLAYFDKTLGAYPFLDTLYMTTLIPISDRKADWIFAVSEHTKRDIVRYCRVDPGKLTVVYEAADDDYKPVSDKSVLESVRDKYRLPEKFILYVGSLSPRKNIGRLLEAFANVRDRVPHHLVLTASKSWKDSQVYEIMNRLGLKDRINKLGYVESADMAALYNLADAYVYPSLYEGFGLPILEAMQCGCPVVASNATSIPEVAGDAAILVDPLDTGALAEAIQKVLIDPELRAELVSRGFEQARKFSWDKAAKIILKKIRDRRKALERTQDDKQER